MMGTARYSDRIQTGMDVGSNKICCAITEIDSGGSSVKLLGIGLGPSGGLLKGSIVHRDQLINGMDFALREAQKMANLTVDKLTLGISGNHIRGINTQGAIAIQSEGAAAMHLQSEITPNDVHLVLDQAKAISLPVDRDILHVLPQEFIIDSMNSIKDPVGLTGRRLEAKVHLITAATTAATNLASCAEELGISVDGLIFQGLASGIAVLDEDEKKLGAACIDIGATTTDVVVYHEGGIRHAAVLGIGADSITNDIAVMLQIGIEEAEKIKLKYGSAKASLSSPELEFELLTKSGGLNRKISEHELSRYIEARMIEILQLIKREIARGGIKEKLTYGMVLTGGGAMLKNIVGLAQENLGIPVRVGNPRNISGVVDIANSPIYAGALGLAQWKQLGNDITLANSKISPVYSVIANVKKWIQDFF
ncbi:MAG: cell division protein FtsA [Candidatus Neomarinimicrobiota bacterium]